MASLNTNDCLQASTNVKNFIEKEGQLPNYVTIAGKKYSMEQYMYISSSFIAAEAIAGTKARPLDFKKVGVAKPKITPIKADIDKKTFYDMNMRVANYFVKNNRAPSYVSSKYGNVQFQAHIYANAKILNYYKIHKIMPNYVSLNLAKNSKILNYLPEYLVVQEDAKIYSCIEVNSSKKIRGEIELLLYVFSDKDNGTNNINKVVIEIEGYEPVTIKKQAENWEQQVDSILIKGKPENIAGKKSIPSNFMTEKASYLELTIEKCCLHVAVEQFKIRY